MCVGFRIRGDFVTKISITITPILWEEEMSGIIQANCENVERMTNVMPLARHYLVVLDSCPRIRLDTVH